MIPDPLPRLAAMTDHARTNAAQPCLENLAAPASAQNQTYLSEKNRGLPNRYPVVLWSPLPEITGLRLFLPTGQCALTGYSRNADIALTGLPPTPPESPNDFRPPLAGYSRTALSAHSLTITCLQNLSGLSPYCCYIHPGFHHTAVLLRTIHHQGSTWISLNIHRTGSPPPANTCISIHTTRFTFYIQHVSLSIPQQQLSSHRKLRVTLHIPD